jgi:hypothetical protein
MKSCGSGCKKIWQVKCQTKGCGRMIEELESITFKYHKHDKEGNMYFEIEDVHKCMIEYLGLKKY